MRLPDSAHTDRPWRIHGITRDFRLEDVWALPTPGGPDDFPLVIESFTAADPAQGGGAAARFLWTVRWRLGEWFGWDREESGLGGRVASLRERLPADLHVAPAGPEFASLPFRPVYRLEDEFAAEIANRTMHGVLHLGWVADGRGGFHAQMAVLVRPNGRLGAAYMAAIRPFRHRLIYPAMLARIARDWRARTRSAP